MGRLIKVIWMISCLRRERNGVIYIFTLWPYGSKCLLRKWLRVYFRTLSTFQVFFGSIVILMDIIWCCNFIFIYIYIMYAYDVHCVIDWSVGYTNVNSSLTLDANSKRRCTVAGCCRWSQNPTLLGVSISAFQTNYILTLESKIHRFGSTLVFFAFVLSPVLGANVNASLFFGQAWEFQTMNFADQSSVWWFGTFVIFPFSWE